MLKTTFSLVLLFFLFPVCLSAEDAGVSSILSPVSGCGFSTTEPVVVEITNYGAAPLSIVDIVFLIDGVPGSLETYTGLIAPGGTDLFTFSATADLSGDGSWDFAAQTQLPGDTDPSNDRLSLLLVTATGPVLPLADQFTSYTPPATLFTSGLVNSTTDDLNFQVQNGPTPSSATGPNEGADGGGNYIYIESSSPAGAGDFAILSTGCLDLSAGIAPRLTYAYHMYGNGIGFLLVTAVQGSHTDTLSLFTGQQQTTSAAPWLYDTADLSSYIGGSIEIRFQAQIGLSGSSFNADIALDDILIEAPQPADLAATALVNPMEACGLSSAELVTIRVSNFGLTGQTGFDVGYQFSGPTGDFHVTENTGLLILSPGESENFAFISPVDLSIPGTYAVKIWTALGGDAVPGNDTLELTFSLPGLSLPDYENFDSYMTGDTVFVQWSNVAEADEPFQIIFGATPSIATGPAGDVNGSGGYLYMEASNMAYFESAAIRSTCIPLLSGTEPKLIYAYHLYGEAIGSLVITVDTGGTSTVIGGGTGPQQMSESDPWRYDTLDLSPFLGSYIELMFTGNIGSSGTSFNADISLDDFSILNPLPNDLGVSAVLGPVSSCGDLSDAAVTVVLENFGTLPQSGFNVGYRISGPVGTSLTEENAGSLVLNPGGVASYTFSSTANLFADGLYTLSVWTILPGDEYVTNDTLAVAITNLPSAADLSTGPLEDHFDGYPDGSTMFLNFVNDPSADIPFEVNYGATASAGTGPSGDVSGSGGYIYMESSGSLAGDQARICTGCLDLSGTVSPVLEFGYFLYGAAIGTLNVSVESLAPVIFPFSLSGQQQMSEIDPWAFATVDLSPWVDQVINVCLTGTVGTGSSSFLSDIAIDEIRIRDIQPVDLSATTLLAPAPTSCDFSSGSLVSVTIYNAGLATQSGFDVGYAVSGPTGSFYVVENVAALSVDPDSSKTYSFMTPADLSADGVYLIQVFTDHPDDAIPWNDTLTTSIQNITAISSFPYMEDFEGFIPCGPACGTDCTSAVVSGWIQDQEDDSDWFPDFGGTPTIATGPAYDQVPGTALGIYLYTESSGTCSGVTSNLISPCIDVSLMTLPAVRFFYHMFGANTGTLALDLSTDDGISWSEIWSRTGEDQLLATAPWEQVTRPLTGISGNIRLRFRAITGSGGLSDMAIDGIEVLDVPPFTDLATTALVSPRSGCAISPLSTVSTILQNLGTGPLSGFSVTYEISGPVVSSATENVGAFILLPGQLDTFSFATPADLSQDGLYAVRIFPNLVSDVVPGNDTLLATLTNIATRSLPLSDDFNGYADGIALFDFLENDPLAPLVFETNYGPTSSTGTGPDDDVSAGGGYIYMETSFGTFLDEARICTPCLDLSGGSTAPYLDYGYHMAGAAIGSLRTQVIKVADTTTVDLFTGAQQISENAPWKFSTVDLSAYDDQAVQVCFTGTIGPPGSGLAFQSDIALDQIRFRDPSQDDLSVTEVLGPVSSCDLGAGEIVSVRVSNVGVAEQHGFALRYQISGGLIITELFVDTLFSDETVVYNFSTPADFSGIGDYLLQAYTSLPGDDNPANDGTSLAITHVQTVSDFPYVENFESGAPGWTYGGLNSTWEIGVPAGPVINTAVSGTQVLSTNLTGFYNPSERSTALSPCLDLSGMDNPGIRMSLNFNSQASLFSAEDGAVLQTSVDQGITWRNVGSFGDPDGWYNANDIASNPGDQLPGLTVANGWSGNSEGWLVVRHGLDGLAGEPSVALRLAFASDATLSSFDGIALDDFTVADMPFANLGPDQNVCAGFLLDAGNPGDSYLWNTGATTQSIAITSSGFYSVNVTDSFGFSASDGINITVLPTPVVELGLDLEVCGSATLDAGNPAAEYLWNTGEVIRQIVVTVSGTYAVLVTGSNGCSARDTVEVLINQFPEAGFSFSQSAAFVEFFDGSTGGTAWSWDFGDGTFSSEVSPNHVYSASGNYLVTLIVTNECGSDTSLQTLAVFVNGLDDPDLAANWSIYPVPTSGMLFMDIAALGEVQVAMAGVFDAAGRLVLLHAVQRQATLDLSGLAAGQYLIRLDAGGRMASAKVSVE